MKSGKVNNKRIQKKIIHLDQILTVFLVSFLEIKIGKSNNPKNKIEK